MTNNTPDYEDNLYFEDYVSGIKVEKSDKLIKENAQLKELLKECQHILKEQNFYRNTPIETDTTYRTRCLKKQELLTKIDEALPWKEFGNQ